MKNRYFTMCVSFLVLSGEILAEQQSAPIHYNNRIVFFPNHLCYERIKPDSMYAGIEGCVLSFLNPKKTHLYLNAEVRIGYNFFFVEKEHVTPFLAFGYIEEFNVCHWQIKHENGIGYGAMGVLYEHEFNGVYSLGVNSQLILGNDLFNNQDTSGFFVIGFDVAIPVTFRRGKQKNWDFRLEPFNTYLHQSRCSQNIYGLRSTIGYRF